MPLDISMHVKMIPGCATGDHKKLAGKHTYDLKTREGSGIQPILLVKNASGRHLDRSYSHLMIHCIPAHREINYFSREVKAFLHVL